MNIASVLKNEIMRLSRKEIKKAAAALKAETAKLRKDVAALRATLVAATKENRQLRAECKKGASATLVTAAMVGGNKAGNTKAFAPLVKTVKRVRQKLGLSQEEFAELCGVQRVTVARWETGSGRIGFRGVGTAERVAQVMQMRKADAKAALAASRGGRKDAAKAGDEPVKAKSSRKTKKAAAPAKAAKKAGRKPAKSAKPAKSGDAAAKPTYKRLGKVTRAR